VLGLGLALSASLSWGIADFIGGLQARRTALLRVMVLSQGMALLLLALVVLIRGQGPPPLHRLWPPAAAGLAGIAGLSAFYRALSIGKMSIVAPIAATGVSIPVIVGIAGGEHPAALQLVGILAAGVGVVLASRETEHAPQSTAARTARVSVGLALVAAVGFGTFAVGLRAGARGDVLWTLVVARSVGVSAVLVAFLVRRPAPERVRPQYPLLALQGTLDLGANGLYALATRHGLLSVVAVGASLYPLVTVLLARLVLGERVRRIQELGIVAAVTGVVLIAAG
jgi:drug/metabolite transporter (DMT)-like permease